MNNTLICFFSASSNKITKQVAEKLAKIIQGDLFEIEPKEIYTEKDLDWTNNESRSSIEMQNKNSRPGIKNKINNLDNYNKVIIGFPIWWYTAPTIINTFLEENNLEGKDIYIFITSGSSTDKGIIDDLKETYPKLNYISSKRFTKEDQEDSYLEWIRE